ncbi:MAG: GNAT family N-acetyltransferase [Planctomycetota bacterium]
MGAGAFHVRPARVADAGPAATLAAELVRFHHQLDAKRFAILADPLEPGYARFLGTLPSRAGAVLLVAEARPRGASAETAGQDDETGTARDEGSPLVGYAFGIVEGPSWPDLLDVHGRFHDLFVHPAYRRCGVGRALAVRMLAELCARGAPRIVLSAAWANPVSRKLFESLGFRPTMVEMTREC